MTPGLSIAHYRISSKLGEGGMGAVYRATDTKLNRDVAIKVLPDAFALDPERLARFRREAQVLAALNHPNIASIYGVEDRALVMELVEGDTLCGPLPLEQAMPLIQQLIDALEYAHEKGIVHRDLKPANIKVTPEGRLKVLDFGLAKAMASEAGPASDPAVSPTITMRASLPGAILGTAAYMAPEQARGKSVDKRADIWAFGAVVYELLTGRRLFDGESISDTLSAVLTKTPDLDAVPERVRGLLRVCLERDPKRRLRDIGEAWRQLEDRAPATGPAAEKKSLPWIVAVSIAVVAAVVFAALWWRTPRASGNPLVALDLDLGAPVDFSGIGASAVLSPDGTRVVLVLQGENGVTRLATRRLDQSKVVELAGTETAYGPFFSPDGQWVGFFAAGKLKKVRIDGGQPVELCDAASGRGAVWGNDNSIYAVREARGGLSRIPEIGGTPEVVLKTDVVAREVAMRWPQRLPDGRILLTVNSVADNFDSANIAVFSPADGKKKVVMEKAGMHPRYLTSGHLTYVTKGNMFAVPFDLDRLEVTGRPAPALEEISNNASFASAQISFADNGSALYRKGRSEGSSVMRLLSAEKPLDLALPAEARYVYPAWSPEGHRIAFTETDGTNPAIWVVDLRRGSKTRVSGDSLYATSPTWSPNGEFLVFNSGGEGIFWVRPDGANQPQRLFSSERRVAPTSFTADGSRLVYAEFTAERGSEIRTVPIAGGSQPQAGESGLFLKSSADNPTPIISPDGKWMAYSDTESGPYEVYVRSFPDRGVKWQVSTGGGINPRWPVKGGQLFYAGPGNRIMAVNYSVNGDSFAPEKPRQWSPAAMVNLGLNRGFDISPDGQRAVALVPVAAAKPQESLSHATLLLNFTDELRRRVK